MPKIVQDPKTFGSLAVIASAILYGCMPIGAQVIYETGCNAPTLALLRCTLPLPALWLLAQWKGPPPAFSKGLPAKFFLLSSLGMVLTPVLLYSSYNHISSGAATTLHFIYPVFVMVGCVLFFREKLTPLRLVCILLCTAGIALFYIPQEADSLLGMLLALASGFVYAVYIIYLGRVALPQMNPFWITFFCSVAGAVLLLLYVPLSGQLALPQTPFGWLFSFVFATTISVGAIVLFQTGVKIVGAQNASILSTFEPITSILVGRVVFHEILTVSTTLGILLILAAVVVLTVFGKHKRTT